MSPIRRADTGAPVSFPSSGPRQEAAASLKCLAAHSGVSIAGPELVHSLAD
jgi:hypothetical protein